MSGEYITREDLQVFRVQLLNDIRQVLSISVDRAEDEEWLKSNEVRKILKVSPNTLQNLRIAGKLTPVKVSGSWRYRQKEVRGLLTIKKA